MKEAFLPAYGPTSFSSFLSTAIAMGALSTEEAAEMAQKEGGMERPEEEQMFDRGVLAAQFKRYEEAVAIFTDLLARQPNDEKSRYNRARVYLSQFRYEEARVEFERILGINPGRKDVLVNLSHLFLATDSATLAQQKAQLALRLDPNCAAATVNLAHSFVYKGRVLEAEQAYGRSVANYLDEAARARLIAALSDDLEEFHQAGWPEEKLEELALQIRCLELRLSRQEMLKEPAADGRDGFIGAKLEILRNKSDFFTWFHFEPIGEGLPDEQEITTEFRPSGPAFRAYVVLKVTTNSAGKIRLLRLDVARRFIDDRRDGIYAADLGKSFLRNAAAPSDRSVLDALASEIEANGRTSLPVIKITGPDDAVQPRQPLSPAACAFFGRTEAWETRLAKSQFTMSHFQHEGEWTLRMEMKSLIVIPPGSAPNKSSGL